MKKITAKEAYKIMDRLGLDHSGDDGITFYAYDEENDEVYDFYSKQEREEFLANYR